jgi:hypothetical protein
MEPPKNSVNYLRGFTQQAALFHVKGLSSSPIFSPYPPEGTEGNHMSLIDQMNGLIKNHINYSQNKIISSKKATD